MAISYSQSLVDFDLEFLSSTSGNSGTEFIKKQKNALQLTKTKIIKTSALVTKFCSQKYRLEQTEKNLAMSKEECKEACIKYSTASERVSTLEQEIKNLVQEKDLYYDKYIKTVNICEGFQCHVKQMQALVAENEQKLLNRENKILSLQSDKKNISKEKQLLHERCQALRSRVTKLEALLSKSEQNAVDRVGCQDDVNRKLPKKVLIFESEASSSLTCFQHSVPIEYLESEKDSHDETPSGTNLMDIVTTKNRSEEQPIYSSKKNDGEKHCSEDYIFDSSSIDTGCGSSLTSPDYISDCSPLNIDSDSLFKVPNTASVATSPIRYPDSPSYVPTAVSMDKSTSTRDDFVSIYLDKECNTEDISDPCMTDKVDEDNIEIETILNRMSMDIPILTPIPPSPTMFSDKTTQCGTKSSGGEHQNIMMNKVKNAILAQLNESITKIDFNNLIESYNDSVELDGETQENINDDQCLDQSKNNDISDKTNNLRNSSKEMIDNNNEAGDLTLNYSIALEHHINISDKTNNFRNSSIEMIGNNDEAADLALNDRIALEHHINIPDKTNNFRNSSIEMIGKNDKSGDLLLNDSIALQDHNNILVKTNDFRNSSLKNMSNDEEAGKVALNDFGALEHHINISDKRKRNSSIKIVDNNNKASQLMVNDYIALESHDNKPEKNNNCRNSSRKMSKLQKLRQKLIPKGKIRSVSLSPLKLCSTAVSHKPILNKQNTKIVHKLNNDDVFQKALKVVTELRANKREPNNGVFKSRASLRINKQQDNKNSSDASQELTTKQTHDHSQNNLVVPRTNSNTDHGLENIHKSDCLTKNVCNDTKKDDTNSSVNISNDSLKSPIILSSHLTDNKPFTEISILDESSTRRSKRKRNSSNNIDIETKRKSSKFEKQSILPNYNKNISTALDNNTGNNFNKERLFHDFDNNNTKNSVSCNKQVYTVVDDGNVQVLAGNDLSELPDVGNKDADAVSNNIQFTKTYDIRSRRKTPPLNSHSLETKTSVNTIGFETKLRSSRYSSSQKQMLISKENKTTPVMEKSNITCNSMFEANDRMINTRNRNYNVVYDNNGDILLHNTVSEFSDVGNKVVSDKVKITKANKNWSKSKTSSVNSLQKKSSSQNQMPIFKDKCLRIVLERCDLNGMLGKYQKLLNTKNNMTEAEGRKDITDIGSSSKVVHYDDLDIFENNDTSPKANCSVVGHLRASTDDRIEDAFFSKMLVKYGTRRCKTTKSIKESAIKRCQQLEEEISRILELPDRHVINAINNLIQTISTVNVKLFLSTVTEFLKSPMRKNDVICKKFTPPAPAMSKQEQVLLYIVVGMHQHWPHNDIVNKVLLNIEYTIFRLNYTPEFEQVENLSHFYAVLCRYIRAKKRLRMFMLDGMYCMSYMAVILVRQCLDVWPHVLPLAHMSAAKNPLVFCLVYLVHYYKSVDYGNRLENIRMYLKKNYFYEMGRWNQTKMLEYFRSLILEINDNPLDKKTLRISLIILAKRHGPTWCQSHIVKSMLQQMIDDRNLPERVKLFCVSLLGPVIRPYPSIKKIDLICVINNLRKLFEDVKCSHQMQEVILASLIYLSKHDESKVVQILQMWQPSCKLSSQLENLLRDCIRSKSIKIWLRYLP